MYMYDRDINNRKVNYEKHRNLFRYYACNCYRFNSCNYFYLLDLKMLIKIRTPIAVPTISILKKEFVYVPSAQTDIRKTFAKLGFKVAKK